MSELLKINNLWGGYKEGVDILRGISMEVQQGEAVGIIGLNGSGKSTFGKAIMNMIPIRKEKSSSKAKTSQPSPPANSPIVASPSCNKAARCSVTSPFGITSNWLVKAGLLN